MTLEAHLDGASTWEEGVFGAFSAHVKEEEEILARYRELASDAASPDIAYLLKMIIADEERHHALFNELAATVSRVVEMSPDSPGVGVPDVPLRRHDSARLRATVNELLRFERDDARRLHQLRRDLRPVADTTIWPLLVEAMELDTKKHVLILKHILGISNGIFGD